MRKAKFQNGFTMVELMVALIVMSIIMSAVATIAFAFSTANDASSDADRKQAQVRYASLRISELIRYSKLICGTPDNSIVIWKADDNPENDEIDIPELVYIDLGSGRDSIRIIELSSYPVGISSDWWPQVKVDDLELWTLQQSSIKDMLLNNCETREIEVIPDCSNAQFSFDQPGTPPNSRFINLSFDLTENDVVRPYHIDSAIRSWAGHQISADGYGIIDDDD